GRRCDREHESARGDKPTTDRSNWAHASNGMTELHGVAFLANEPADQRLHRVVERAPRPYQRERARAQRNQRDREHVVAEERLGLRNVFFLVKEREDAPLEVASGRDAEGGHLL